MGMGAVGVVMVLVDVVSEGRSNGRRGWWENGLMFTVEWCNILFLTISFDDGLLLGARLVVDETVASTRECVYKVVNMALPYVK